MQILCFNLSNPNMCVTVLNFWFSGLGTVQMGVGVMDLQASLPFSLCVSVSLSASAVPCRYGEKMTFTAQLQSRLKLQIKLVKVILLNINVMLKFNLVVVSSFTGLLLSVSAGYAAP